MLKNYIKIAWRNLVRQKSSTIINLSGLAVGFACCILIALYAREELSYDRFHEHADRIAAVGVEHPQFGTMLSTPYPLVTALEEEVPEVEKATRLQQIRNMNLSENGQDYIEIDEARYAEPDFFEIFSFELIYGNTDHVLKAPGEIVLTRTSSERLFGESNSIGKSVYWIQRDTTVILQVSGVVKEPPQNSSISFQALISMNTIEERYRDPSSWGAFSYQTYAMVSSPSDFKTLPDRFQKLAERQYENTSRNFVAYPLSSLHLSDVSHSTGFTGNIKYLYLFGSVAVFILLIACINYINLSTARVSLRSKEIGIRKTAGAGKGQLAVQFLSESVLLSVGAYALALLLAELALPLFRQLFGTHIDGSTDMIFLLWLGVGAVATGLVAGIYPSLYLAGISPSTILRNNLPAAGSGVLLRKGLVVGQFGIALILIMGAMVIYEQLQFAQTKDLGFDGEQVVVVQLPNQQSWQARNILHQQVDSHAGIRGVTVANGAPGSFYIRESFSSKTLSPESRTGPDEVISIAPAVVDYDFIDVLDIQLLAGRNFSEQNVSDPGRAVILNKKAAELLGWSPEEAIGKPFMFDDREGEVIGVVENFHIASLHREIEPIVLQLHESSSWSAAGLLLARLDPDEIPQSMNFLKDEIAKYAPNLALKYEFLDDKFDAMYRTELRLGQVVTLFTFIAIFVACLGLYGLAAFAAERRIKEIGIRKVLGATVVNIVALLNKDFLKLVLLGFLIAVPVAWYAMNQWLADFAYRIEIGAGIFLLSGAAAVLIALFTVSWQSIRAATLNPVESLRSE
ncbi:MAG: ABC transporter permease [Balneolaceae bacterium]